MAVYYDEAHKTYYCKFRYTDWTGKSRHTSKRGFRTKREAKAYEHDFKAKASDSPDMTMKALCEDFLSDMEKRIRESSMESFRGCINHYILPVRGEMKLSDISRATVSKWQQWLAGRKTMRGGRPISQGTMASMNSILVTILNYAVRMEYMEHNPAASIPKVGKMGKRTAFWEKADYDRFIEAGRGDKNFEDFHLFFDVLFYSGIRIAEYFGLGCNSFDFEHNTMTLLHGCKFGRKVPLKNASSYRTIPMPPSLMGRIKDFMGTLDEVPEYGMFPYGEDTLRRIMKKWADRAGLPYIMLHGLRHSHVSYLISLGIPITAISNRIGHKNPNVTLGTYSHMYKQDGTGIAGILESQMNVGQSLVKGKTKSRETQ